MIECIDLWKWLSVGVDIMNKCTIEDKLEKAVPTAVVEISAVL